MIKKFSGGYIWTQIYKEIFNIYKQTFHIFHVCISQKVTEF